MSILGAKAALRTKFYGSNLTRAPAGRATARFVSTQGSEPVLKASRPRWKNVEQRRIFFRGLNEILNLSSMDSWYSVSRQQISKLGGSSILTKYHKNNLSAVLAEAFPDHHWEEWRFAVTPRGFWRKVENQRRLFQSVLKAFGGSSLEDWYRMVPEAMSQFPGASV
jgi:hypothetical protein